MKGMFEVGIKPLIVDKLLRTARTFLEINSFSMRDLSSLDACYGR